MIIGVSQTIQFKRRDSRLGELNLVLYCLLHNYMIGSMWFCLICIIGLKMLSFGNFPETAWRAVHSRQAAHAEFAYSGFL